MRFLFLFFCPVLAWAHQSSLTPTARPIGWSDPNIPVAINTNTSDLSAGQVLSIVQNSIDQWNSAGSAQIYQNSGSGNLISFKNDFSIYGSGVVGVTEVSYNTDGSILGANIFLNDNYTFTNVQDSRTSIYLGDVVTHELGHMFGLSHSEVLDASMFYSSFRGQSTISYDDKAGLRQKYSGNFGTITGYMKGGEGVGVLGVHVQAISRRTGEIVSAVSDENGKFLIGGLDLEDTFYLYSSPLKYLDALPDYFSNTQSNFCPGAFVGSFFDACGHSNKGFPQAINLTSMNSEIDVGTVTINCTLRSNEEYSFQKLQFTPAPVTIFDYGVDQRFEKAFVGHVKSSTLTTWSKADKLVVDLRDYTDLFGSQKYFKMNFTGRKFGNQLEYQLAVKQNEVEISPAASTLTQSLLTSTKDADFELMLPLDSNPANNIFELSIRSRKLSNTDTIDTFPAYDQFSSNRFLPFLVIASIWEAPLPGMYQPVMDSQSNLSDNASCLDGPYTYAVSKAQPASGSAVASESAGVAAAGCGSIEPPDQGGGGPGNMSLMVGFMLAAILSQMLKRSKKFLS